MKRKYKSKDYILGISLFLGDLLLLGLAFYLAFKLRFALESLPSVRSFVEYYVVYSIIGVLVTCLFFYANGLYSFKNLYMGMGENAKIIIGTFVSFFIIMVANYYVNRMVYQLSRLWILYAIILSVVMVIGGRILVKRLLTFIFGRIGLSTNILIVGINEESRRIANALVKNKREKVNIVGFISEKKDDGNNEVLDYSIGSGKVLGNLDKLIPLIKVYNVNRIIFSVKELGYFDIMQLFEKIKNLNVEVDLSPSLFEFSVSRMQMFEEMGVTLIQIREAGLKGPSKIIKFFINFLSGIFLFIIFVILYPFIAILIKMDSPGPVFYSQERYGKDFKKIKIYKFRTMVADADRKKGFVGEVYKRDRGFKIKNDPRITRVGKILRKTSIDELPQAINVLKGELSVVGPRALAIKEGGLLEDWERKRMSVNQGITGLWQVSGRSDLTYEERMRLDLYYIQNWSIWLEIRIIILTIIKILFGKGAY